MCPNCGSFYMQLAGLIPAASIKEEDQAATKIGATSAALPFADDIVGLCALPSTPEGSSGPVPEPMPAAMPRRFQDWNPYQPISSVSGQHRESWVCFPWWRGSGRAPRQLLPGNVGCPDAVPLRKCPCPPRKIPHAVKCLWVTIRLPSDPAHLRREHHLPAAESRS
ncbi:hypothetical protein FKM82_005925 [Ascaphus truei]